MSLPVLVYLLTIFAAAVVVATRLRAPREASSHHYAGSPMATLHTVAGGLAVLVWGAFLVFGEDTFLGGALVGVLGLGCWWLTMFAGLLLLTRWLPNRGKRAVEPSSLGARMATSFVGHLGLAAAVLVFTWAYLTSAV